MKSSLVILIAFYAVNVAFTAPQGALLLNITPRLQSDCICVPYYLCNSTFNGTIYLHGEGILDLRMGQIITPKECPTDAKTPEICCNIPEINDHAPKPTQILTELNKIIITQEEAERLISKFEQSQHEHVIEPQMYPSFTPVTESIVTVTPCSLGKRTFGNQGYYEITPIHNCEETEEKKPSSISRNFFMINNKKSSVEIKREDTHHIHISESSDHSAGNKGLLEVSSDLLFTTEAPVLIEDDMENLSPFGHTYGTPQPVPIEHSTEMHVPDEHEETKYEGTCGSPIGLGVRLMGGQVDDLPWLVEISTKEPYNNKPKPTTCGGSLILDKLVLTAAHCIAAASKNHETLVVQTSRKDQESIVYRTIVHPDYNPSSLLYDFALLWLETPIHLGTQFGTGLICLPPPKIEHSLHCFATGFHQGHPSKVEIPLVPHHKCQHLLRTTRLGRLFHLHYSFVCAGGQKDHDTCKGDGGSPLVCSVGEGPNAPLTQIGLVAWGIGCGTEIPGVYANLGVARSWIDYEVKTAGYDPLVYHVPLH